MKSPFSLIALALLVFAGVVASQPAKADIITSVSGSITRISAPDPTTLGDNDTILEEDEQFGSNAFVWMEQSLIATGGTSIATDHDGSSGTFANLGSLTAGSLANGTSNAYSYYFLFDFDSSTGTGTVSGSITFSEEITGIIISNSLLETSDTLYENPDYGTVGGGNWTNRDWTLPASDQFTISANRMTLGFTLQNAGAGNTDHMRILLNPEPSTWALFALGGLGMAGIARRRRRKRAAAAAAADTD